MAPAPAGIWHSALGLPCTTQSSGSAGTRKPRAVGIALGPSGDSTGSPGVPPSPGTEQSPEWRLEEPRA